VEYEYASWQELKEMRAITSSSQDEALQRAIRRASRAIYKKCGGRRFDRAGVTSVKSYSTYGRTVRSGTTESLLVDDIADPATISCTLGGTTATFSVSPYGDGEPVTSLDRASWYGGDIVITAEWGWPEVPADIEQATLLLANRRYMRKDSPEGTSGYAAEGAIGVSRFDSDIEDLVAPYVRFGFGA
jgi:hypothetical protein